MNTLLISALLTISPSGIVTCPGASGGVELYQSNDMKEWQLAMEFTNQTTLPTPLQGTNRFYRARMKGAPVRILSLWMTNGILHGRANKVLTNILWTAGTTTLQGYQVRQDLGLSNGVPFVRWVEFAFPKGATNGRVDLWDLDGYRASTNGSTGSLLPAPLPGSPSASFAPSPSPGEWQVVSHAYAYSYYEKAWFEKRNQAQGNLTESNAWMHMEKLGSASVCVADYSGPGLEMGLTNVAGECVWSVGKTYPDWAQMADYTDTHVYSRAWDELKTSALSATSVWTGNYGAGSNVVVRISVGIANVKRWYDEVWSEDGDGRMVRSIGGQPCRNGTITVLVPSEGAWIDVTPMLPVFWKGWIEHWPNMIKL